MDPETRTSGLGRAPGSLPRPELCPGAPAPVPRPIVVASCAPPSLSPRFHTALRPAGPCSARSIPPHPRRSGLHVPSLGSLSVPLRPVLSVARVSALGTKSPGARLVGPEVNFPRPPPALLRLVVPRSWEVPGSGQGPATGGALSQGPPLTLVVAGLGDLWLPLAVPQRPGMSSRAVTQLRTLQRHLGSPEGGIPARGGGPGFLSPCLPGAKVRGDP